MWFLTTCGSCGRGRQYTTCGSCRRGRQCVSLDTLPVVPVVEADNVFLWIHYLWFLSDNVFLRLFCLSDMFDPR